MQKILIIGATSAMAEAVARRYAARKANVYLLARNAGRLATIAADLEIRGAASVHTATFDANDRSSYEELLDAAHRALGSFDIVLLAHGSYGDQKTSEASAEEAVHEFQVNTLSTVALLTILANRMERQGSGTLALISSVAGDRGRPSNYVYGSSKAAVSTFSEGLRARLHKKGVHVLTIKPGMVDTPMTEGLDLPQLLVANPEDVASDIVRAVDRHSDVLYTPWYWRYVMWVIIHMPRKVFKKLDL